VGILDNNAKALWDELKTRKGLLVYEQADGNLMFTYKGTPADAVGLNLMAQEAIVRRAWQVHKSQESTLADNAVEAIKRGIASSEFGKGLGEPVKMPGSADTSEP